MFALLSQDALKKRQDPLHRVRTSWSADIRSNRASIAVYGSNAFRRFGLPHFYGDNLPASSNNRGVTKDPNGYLHITNPELLVHSTTTDLETGMTMYEAVCALVPEMTVWSMGSVTSENISIEIIKSNIKTISDRRQAGQDLHEVNSRIKPKKKQSACYDSEGIRLWVYEPEPNSSRALPYEYTLILRDYAEGVKRRSSR